MSVEAELREARAHVEELKAEVERRSIDALTGVAGRGVFERSLQTSYARVRRTKVPSGVLMLDVDRFKRVNDDFGHVFGDCVLRAVAQAAAFYVRESDLFARYGGEEFVAVIDRMSRRGLTVLAERIRKSVAALEFDYEGFVGVTVSIGAALMYDNDDDPFESIKRADVGLYRAKNSGRDRVEFGD